MKHVIVPVVLSFLVIGAFTRPCFAQDTSTNDLKVIGGAIATTSQDGSGGGIVLGFRYTPDKPPYEVAFYFNTSSRKTITNEKNFVGTSLLGPETDTQGFQFRFMSALVTPSSKKNTLLKASSPLNTLSFYARAGASQLNFKDASASATTDPVDGSVVAYYTGFVLSKDIMETATKPSGYRYGLTAGISGRNLSGDILQENALRKSLFGTEKKSFISSEVGAFLKVKDVLYFARHTNFGGSLKGFSGSQVLVGAEAIFPLK